MKKYTLKTFYGNKQLEVFEHRQPQKLRSILLHPRHTAPETEDGWGVPIPYATRFEIFDHYKLKLFDGSLDNALAFSKRLK